jgi:hypothetical protein
MNIKTTMLSKIWKVFDWICWLNYGKFFCIVCFTVGRISSTVGQIYKPSETCCRIVRHSDLPCCRIARHSELPQNRPTVCYIKIRPTLKIKFKCGSNFKIVVFFFFFSKISTEGRFVGRSASCLNRAGMRRCNLV